VAGILYNAMLLDHGMFPYVDSVELKAPGTFYLGQLLAAPGGRNIGAFQLWANLVALASLLGVAGIAWRLWGLRAACFAAGLYAMHDGFLDSMDANYVTWAQLPQILAFGAAVSATRPGHSRRRTLLLWGLAGLLGGFAVLCKRPVGVVTGVVGLWALLHRGPLTKPDEDPPKGWLGRFALDIPAGFAVTFGVCLAHVPIFVHYAAGGHVGGLIDGYVLNRWGLRYLAERGGAGWLYTAREGVFATVHFLALPLFLACFALFTRRRPGSTTRTWLLVWAAFTLFAASLGGRFYKGYFVPVLPALCILAAAPWGIFGREWIVGIRHQLRVQVRVVVVLLGLLLAGRASLQMVNERSIRAGTHDRGGRVIAEHLHQNLRPGDRIWVWGWHLWDCYVYTGHLSGSAVYKSMGLLTRPNDDTWREPGASLRMLDPSPYRKKLISDLERTRPAYIVLGSTVPRGAFSELQTLLRDGYIRDRRVRLGRVQFWRRRDHANRVSTARK